MILLQVHHREAVPVEVRPPSIARARGITVGLTTLERYEKRHGKALRLMGGHNGGDGEWYDTRSGTLIHAGGFSIAEGGEILDGCAFWWLPKGAVPKNVPRIRLRTSDLGLLARLRKGMSRRAVEGALGVRLTTDTFHRAGLIRYDVKPSNQLTDRYVGWTVNLTFGGKGLEAFATSCR